MRAYNGTGPAAEAYATRVLADARVYASGDFAVDEPACGCDVPALAGAGSAGKVVVAAGANRPGVPIQRIDARLRRPRWPVSTAGPIVISTGTNH